MRSVRASAGGSRRGVVVPSPASEVGGSAGGSGAGSGSLASHTLQSPRERGSGNFAYIELYTLQDPGATNQIADFQRYHNHAHVQCY